MNRASTAARTMLQEFLPSSFLGVPSTTYEDPYVWGYLAEVIMIWLDASYPAKVKFSADEKARIARGAIAGTAGMTVSRYLATKHTLSDEEINKGMRDAHKMIAVMSGQLGPQDDPELAPYFEAASRMGFTGAAGAAGLLKRDQLGRRTKAADQCLVEAQQLVEITEVLIDTEAAKRLRKAAELGNAKAQREIAECYASGKGVLKDLVQAYKWFLVAAAHGENSWFSLLRVQGRVMTPDQITEAKRLAREWKPTE
jgi:hypothetical protein